MNLTLCDRCNRLISDGAAGSVTVTVTHGHQHERRTTSALCRPCADALRDWWATPPERYSLTEFAITETEVQA